jgi:DNA-binding MarR family transcriptional regulator
VTNLTETTPDGGRHGRGMAGAATQRWTPLPALLDDLAGDSFVDFHARMKEAGYTAIRQGHGCVFRFIHEGGSRLTQLAESSGLSKQAVGEVVDDLERLGYVERAQDPEDGRAKVIRLTEQGAEAQRTALGIFADIERDLAERYGAERVATMRELLEEIAAG